MEPGAHVPASVRPFIERLAAVPGVRRVVLYGSRARGDYGDRSDVDLAVDAPGLSTADWARLRLDADDTRTLYQIDLVRLDDAPARLRRRIEAEGVDV